MLNHYAYIQKADTSFSCGWSQPAHVYVGKSSENIDLANDYTDSSRNLKVPIPICCHPLSVGDGRLKVDIAIID